MPPDHQSIGETLRTFVVSAVRIVLYLPLLGFRVLARLLLLAATVLPVALPFIVGVALLELWQEHDLGTKIADSLQENHALVTGLAYFVGVGLFANYLKDMVSTFWAAVRGVLEPISDVFLGERNADGMRPNPWWRAWVPSAEVRESLAGTWHDNIAQTRRNLTLSVGRNALLTAVAALGAVVVAVTMPFVLRETKVDRYVWVATPEPRENATAQATDGTQETQETDPPKADAPETDEPDTQKGAGSPPAATPPEPVTLPPIGTQPVLEAHLRNGTVFSLIHLKDAQPKEGDGICLTESQQAWLREFRTAIAACVGAESAERSGAPVRRFDVTAFASVAPVSSSGVASAKLNCEIANRRADAVGAFLVDETKYESKWDCDSVAADFAAARSHCASSSGDRSYQDHTGVYRGAKFNVRVHKWRSHSEMDAGKPADDGALPDDRRYAAEMWNRSVHITVPRGFCRPNGSERSGGSSAADPTADVEE